MIKRSLLIFMSLSYLLPTSKANRFKDIYITPVANDIAVQFSYVVGKNSEVEFLIYIENKDNTHYYLYRKTVYIAFNFTDDFMLFKERVKENSYLVFQAKSIDSSSYIRFELKQQNKIYNLLEQNTFYMEDAIQYLDDREVIHYANETIDFNNLTDEMDLILPYIPYNHIWLTQKSYFFQDELDIDEITVKILDKNNVFPLLNHVDDYAIIYFELESKNNQFYLSLLDKLYVHTDSLTLSSVPKEGFIRTNYLYLPKNCSENDFKVTIHFKNVGLQKINCYYDYILHRKERYVGSCSSSFNCIKIKESFDYFDTNMSEVLI